MKILSSIPKPIKWGALLFILFIYFITTRDHTVEEDSSGFPWVKILLVIIALGIIIYRLAFYKTKSKLKKTEDDKKHDGKKETHDSGHDHHSGSSKVTKVLFNLFLIVLTVAMVGGGIVWITSPHKTTKTYHLSRGQRLERTLDKSLAWEFKCMKGTIENTFPDNRIFTLRKGEVDQLKNPSTNFTRSGRRQDQRSTLDSPTGVYSFETATDEATLQVTTWKL